MITDKKFWDRVDKQECWIWTGAKTMVGFGKFMTDEGYRSPHRLVYIAYIGPLGKADPVTQTCENKLCVNPEHLVLKVDYVGSWEDRFWEKVQKTDECWIWTGYLDDKGYGRFNIKNVPKLAHRLSYELIIGYEKNRLDHRCHIKNCVNPEHLRPVTNKENGENKKGPPANNKSGYLGVSWSASAGKWLARVQHNGKCYDSYHEDVHDAGETARQRRIELFTHNDLDR